MEWTSTPGATDNNTCFFAVLLTDGNTEFAASGEQGLFGPMITWNNAAGPKIGTCSRGGGFSLSTQDSELVCLRGSLSTTASGTDYPVYRVWTDGYDGDGDIEQTRDTSGTSSWGGSMLSRPTTDAALSVGIGRNSDKGSNSEFSMRIYYRVSPVLTYNGISTLKPGS